MCKKILLGALLGGLTVFLWQAISHVPLPWFHTSLNQFENPEEVEKVLAANAKQDGMYLLPNPGMDASTEEMAQGETQMTEGFSVFGSINQKGRLGYGKALAFQFLYNVLGAALITFILCQFKEGGYGCRIGVAVFFALFAIFTAILPNWSWWGFSNTFTGFLIFDHLVGWTLAGFVLAKITMPKAEV